MHFRPKDLRSDKGLIFANCKQTFYCLFKRQNISRNDLGDIRSYPLILDFCFVFLFSYVLEFIVFFC